ncbi:MAG: N-formylglutamate amidohydrolase [Hyphomicrobium sp.]|jgi:N-formylglutamate amidohydrolase|uniref:N-formylglutamate amidohydrolase n=1 Tax=Hyphomicrobium sp. TaxID=82 RepID=UPI0025C27EAD|nr:N-formylglutamate amidohydrolase [Hyphomicrobium sp.]MBX9862130.1 N-formylglutamate amidohydrolase [Hyphomicrobium sp.]
MIAQTFSPASDPLDPPFTIFTPETQVAPFVLCSPHSGRTYTPAFLAQSRLDPLTLRKSEDCFVDELFQGAAQLGVPMISARFPRAYLDVNREPYELDPELFADPLPDYANCQSVRVVGGLGTIARIVADGEEIYHSRLTVDEALARIEKLYFPFHTALESLIEATRAKFGHAILIDCHSMPSAQMAQSSAPRPDFVIGDRFGAACDPRLTRFLRDTIAAAGYDVQLNRPYAGGYITEHYGRPYRGVQAVQIEINRARYLNEMTFVRTSGFERLQRDLTQIAGLLFPAFGPAIDRPAAAE